jgi:uncharacterized protein (DUF342 family)
VGSLAVEKVRIEMDNLIKKPVRNLRIQTSDDRLEAYITLEYEAGLVKNGQEEQTLMPPMYKVEEIKAELLKAGIIFGFIEENIRQCLSPQGVHKMLAAKGYMAIDGEDDRIVINFEMDGTIKKLQEDKKGNIDFKSIGSIGSVKKGAIVAQKVEGKPGIDGKDVKGKVIKHKPSKKLVLKAGKGCEIVNNTIVSTIEGKPCMKNTSFYVFSVHEVQGDVDITTGNIIFSGDILIQGNVKEAMKVNSGNGVIIKKSVERGEVTAKGDIAIEGSVIGSEITSGGEDSEKLKLMEAILSLIRIVKELITAVEEIKTANTNLSKTTDGQIIKLLLESRYKPIIKLCITVLGSLASSKEQRDIIIISLIKGKLMGLAPISIKHFSELLVLVDELENKEKEIREALSIPVNVRLGYVQDSTVSSSGDIVISGRGAYLSSLYANGSIYFTQETSVVRGGILKASDEIHCKIVGSTSGAHTKLIVDEKGHIFMDIAYENTDIVVGRREFVINYDSKNVHAYLNKDGELNVDRFKL